MTALCEVPLSGGAGWPLVAGGWHNYCTKQHAYPVHHIWLNLQPKMEICPD